MKQYLIRKNLSTYIGPFDLEQLKKYSKGIYCHQDDEIAKSCGRWLRISDTSRLKKYYPELAKIFGSSSSVWHASIHTEKHIPLKKSNKLLLWSFCFSLLIAVVIVSINKDYIFNRLNPQAYEQEVNLVEARESLVSNQRIRFFEIMHTELPDLILDSTRNPTRFKAWLPLLRAYAFMRDGRIDGLSREKLYPEPLPFILANQECSQEYWEQQWRASQPYINEWVAGKLGIDADWARLLLWDPQWINRRPNINWIYPTNLHSGCIIIARKSLINVMKESPSIDYSPFFTRINEQLSALNNEQLLDSQGTKTNFLQQLTCLEVAKTILRIEECSINIESYNSIIYSVLFYRKSLRNLVIQFQNRNKTPVNEVFVELLKQQKSISPFYLFNYSEELDYLRAALVSESAAVEVRKKYPNVRLGDLQ